MMHHPSRGLGSFERLRACGVVQGVISSITTFVKKSGRLPISEVIGDYVGYFTAQVILENLHSLLWLLSAGEPSRGVDCDLCSLKKVNL